MADSGSGRLRATLFPRPDPCREPRSAPLMKNLLLPTYIYFRRQRNVEKNYRDLRCQSGRSTPSLRPSRRADLITFGQWGEVLARPHSLLDPPHDDVLVDRVLVDHHVQYLGLLLR